MFSGMIRGYYLEKCGLLIPASFSCPRSNSPSQNISKFPEGQFSFPFLSTILKVGPLVRGNSIYLVIAYIHERCFGKTRDLQHDGNEDPSHGGLSHDGLSHDGLSHSGLLHGGLSHGGLLHDSLLHGRKH